MRKSKDESNAKSRNKIYPLSIGFLFGISFGTSMHSWVLGLCIGFLWAIAFGLYDDEAQIEQDSNKL